MNKQVLSLITSTGLMIENKNNIFLLYDKYTGFRKDKNNDENIFFFNNLHHDIHTFSNLNVHKFFYYYPLEQERISLFRFFQLFLLNFEKYIEKYSSFIWTIGKLAIGVNNGPTKVSRKS